MKDANLKVLSDRIKAKMLAQSGKLDFTVKATPNVKKKTPF